MLAWLEATGPELPIWWKIARDMTHILFGFRACRTPPLRQRHHYIPQAKGMYSISPIIPQAQFSKHM